jgi:hypothetical protein
LFQKSGAKVFSSSLAISISLASTSKIPPQRTKALHNTFNLFGSCHKFIVILRRKIIGLAVFSPDNSGNPFFRKGLFFVKEKKRPTEALFLFTKKAVLKKDYSE